MYTGPYIQLIENIKAVLQNEPSRRTGLPLTSAYGDFTFFTKRVTNWDELLNNLPAITIDLDGGGFDYIYEDQGAFRLIPVVIVLYMPLYTYGKTADESATIEVAVDEEIKLRFADLEEIMNENRAAHGTAYELLMVEGGGIFYEAFDFGEPINMQLRLAQLNLVARQRIQ